MGRLTKHAVVILMAAAGAMALADAGAGPTTQPAPGSKAAKPEVKAPPGDRRAFALTAAAPGARVLRLTVDPLDRQPGNAALFYLRAAGSIPPDAGAAIDRAESAHDAGETVVVRLKPAVYDELFAATLRANCDWGGSTNLDFLLPQLGQMRTLANLLKIRAWEQMDSTRPADALGWIRAELALAKSVGNGQAIVGGLVGFGIESVGLDSLADLMDRPGSPNLYWSLRTMPSPLIKLQDVVDDERTWIATRVPVLRHGRSDDVRREDLATMFGEMGELQHEGPTWPEKQWPMIDAEIPAELLAQAREYYGRTRNLAADKVALVDKQRVVSVYELEQYHQVQDEIDKVLALPDAEAMDGFKRIPATFADLKINPANPAALTVRSYEALLHTTCRINRTVAVLTTVEAIRSYAAAHQGALPASLDQLLETPAPLNPATGKPFDYKVDGDVATISDETSGLSRASKQNPLVYTVTIRKRGK